MELLAVRSQWNFAHATTVQLLWHVQNMAAIIPLELGWGETEFPLNLNCDGKNVSDMGPSSVVTWMASRV